MPRRVGRHLRLRLPDQLPVLCCRILNAVILCAPDAAPISAQLGIQSAVVQRPRLVQRHRVALRLILLFRVRHGPVQVFRLLPRRIVDLCVLLRKRRLQYLPQHFLMTALIVMVVSVQLLLARRRFHLLPALKFKASP